MEGFRLVPHADAPASAISLAGDSGSLWINPADAHAVGLHFAGEDDASPLNDYALAHPIEDVFARLNVALMPLEEAAVALASMAAAASRPARKRASKRRLTPSRAARAGARRAR
jgi:hypothetical protein